MTAQLRDVNQVVAHSRSINHTGLTSTPRTDEIFYRTQRANSPPKVVKDKTTPRPPYLLLQPCLLQQSFRGYTSQPLVDSSGKNSTDDRHHRIVFSSKVRPSCRSALDSRSMINQAPSSGTPEETGETTEVPCKDLPANQSSSEDDHPIHPRRPHGKDIDSDSTSSDDDSSFFLTEQTRVKVNQRGQDGEAAEERDGGYRFATPLSEDLMRLDLTGMSRVERDWRTLTNVRPKTQTEARILDRLIQMERFQVQTVELETGFRKPIRITSNSIFQGKNATRGRVPSRRGGGYPDCDNIRKSNAAADFVCQLCLERHTVRSCVENVYASRSRSTVDFDKYDRVTPHGTPSNRMGPTVQGRSLNPLAPGAFRGRAKITNGARATRGNNDHTSGSVGQPSSQALQRVDVSTMTGGSVSGRAVEAPSDLIGAFNVLGLQVGQPKGCGESSYSSLKPTLTNFEVTSGGLRSVVGQTKGNLVVPTAVSCRKTSIVDVDVRTTLKPPRLKSATRSLKPGSKRRPQTAA